MKAERHIIVTGGAGYIGSHACKRLQKDGFVPVTIDNLVTGWAHSINYGPFEEIDLLNKSAVQKVFQKYNPEGVIHFAALSNVGDSVSDPLNYWRNNFVGSLNLVESCVEFGCENFVFSSTCATYGEHDDVVLTENVAQKPNNPYGSSKRAVEELLSDVSEAFGLRYVIFRYFNVSGADPEGELGECHHPETHVIPLLLESVSDPSKKFTIFGTDYDTPDGTCIRDYVHVSDLVDAHILGLDWLLKEGDNRVYNLGTGMGFSVKQVLEAVNSVTGQQVPMEKGPRREGDCTRLVSNSKKIEGELGWIPVRSNLEDMIHDSWCWVNSKRDG